MHRNLVSIGLAALALPGLAIGLKATQSNSPAAAPLADDLRVRIPVEQAEREQVLGRLRDEFQNPGSNGWSLSAGCPRVPSYPSAMSSAGGQLYVATEQRLEIFDLASRSWHAEPLELKEPVGPGLVLLGKGEDTLYLLSGGECDSVWKITPSTGKLRALPGLGEPIGRGAALTEWRGELYLNRGLKDDGFWVLRVDAETWVKLGRIGNKSTLDTAFGRNSGFLATLDKGIYAWPNHHIHRFNPIAQRWKNGNWVAMNFLPVFDGGGVATAPGVDSIYAMAGFFSRSLNEISPGERAAFFLRPRLPYPIIGEGDRLTIAKLDGVPQLVVYAVEPANMLCSIPIAKLERVSPDSDQADVGSAWHNFYTKGGGNGVRHWSTRAWTAEPGPMDKTDRRAGTLGVMGAIEGELFTMRRAFTRRIDVEHNVYSFYPGVNLGEYLGMGAAGVFDGQQHVYFMTGRSDYFLRRKIPDARPVPKPPSVLPPIDKTELEVLPGMPKEVGRCGSMAFARGGVYVLRGGETREFWRYDPGTKSWGVLPSLPDEALAIGVEGAGLVGSSDALFALSGEQVWRYDLEQQSWGRFATLGFQMQWDGGMLAADGDRHLYVAHGGYSTRLGRVDLTSGAFEELFPRMPDAVSAEGNRMGVISVANQRRLYIHRGHNSNEIFWIELGELGPK